MKTIIRNAHVLTFDAKRQEFADANILIEGSKIVSVGPGLEFPPSTEPVQEIEASGQLAIPGLINGHFHSSANLMKGSLRSLPLEIFMLHEVPPLGHQLPSERLVYVRTMLGAIEMLKLGITSVQDDAFFVPHPTVESIDALMSAYRDAGLRATVALDQPNVIEYEKYPFLKDLLPSEQLLNMNNATLCPASDLLDLYQHLIDIWHGKENGRLRAAVSCSAPHRVTQDYFAALSNLSEIHDLPFYMHILETKLQRVFGDQIFGKSLVQYVHELGFLNERVNVIHGIWIDDDDMDLIATAGAVIAHNPVCNLRLGSGIMPFRRIRDRGIEVCIGTDEALADDTINVWSAVKMTGLIHNITDPEYRNWPQAREILDCLLLGGAKAMGLKHHIGCIKVGYAADIALLDLGSLAFTPLNELYHHLVYCENGSSVRLTMIDGEVVMRDGCVLHVDEEMIKAEARELVLENTHVLEHATKSANDLEPYYRQMYLQASSTDVGMNRWANRYENVRFNQLG